MVRVTIILKKKTTPLLAKYILGAWVVINIHTYNGHKEHPESGQQFVDNTKCCCIVGFEPTILSAIESSAATAQTTRRAVIWYMKALINLYCLFVEMQKAKIINEMC